MSRYIVIEGNLTETPALGYGESSGKPYIKLNVAVNDRVKAEDGSWTDGPATFYRVTAFGSRAENAAASFTKGDTVIAAGNLTVAGFTRADGSECGLFSAPRLQLLDVLPTARTDRGAQATKRLALLGVPNADVDLEFSGCVSEASAIDVGVDVPVDGVQCGT